MREGCKNHYINAVSERIIAVMTFLVPAEGWEIQYKGYLCVSLSRKDEQKTGTFIVIKRKLYQILVISHNPN